MASLNSASLLDPLHTSSVSPHLHNMKAALVGICNYIHSLTCKTYAHSPTHITLIIVISYWLVPIRKSGPRFINLSITSCIYWNPCISFTLTIKESKHLEFTRLSEKHTVHGELCIQSVKHYLGINQSFRVDGSWKEYCKQCHFHHSTNALK